jgi:hypothetical protein
MRLKRGCDYSKRGELHETSEDEEEEQDKKFVDKGKGKAKANGSDNEEVRPAARGRKKTTKPTKKKMENLKTLKNKAKHISATKGRKYTADHEEDCPAMQPTKSSKKWVDVSDDERPTATEGMYSPLYVFFSNLFP